MPNTNIEENLKNILGSLMLQNAQLQTMVNQLDEKVKELQAELDSKSKKKPKEEV